MTKLLPAAPPPPAPPLGPAPAPPPGPVPVGGVGVAASIAAEAADRAVKRARRRSSSVGPGSELEVSRRTGLSGPPRSVRAPLLLRGGLTGVLGSAVLLQRTGYSSQTSETPIVRLDVSTPIHVYLSVKRKMPELDF